MKQARMSKLESARQLILGMEGLQTRGQVSRAAIRDAGSVDGAVDRQRLGAALTNTVLYTVVVELVVKHIWEQEHGGKAQRTHNVHRLFRELSPQIQREIEDLYDTCCGGYQDAANAAKQQLGLEAVAVDVASLEEALRWNEDAVKNLKYEMTPQGRSVPTGLLWDSTTIWVLPGNYPNFAIELARWAARSGAKRLTPLSGP